MFFSHIIAERCSKKRNKNCRVKNYETDAEQSRSKSNLKRLTVRRVASRFVRGDVGGRVVVLESGGESGVEIGVEREDLGDVAVELLNEGHVLDHVVAEPRLLILVHLIDQAAVAVQHRLHLAEALIDRRPHHGVAIDADVFCGGGTTGGVSVHRGFGGGLKGGHGYQKSKNI
ncbi:hypothetical protein V8G54_035163 [Vigna mungo]|uniref:Uncharacterized protein n=1 Tax=Vigna mungo TaxID=3915 RepID=A0AAQ3MEI5_VIGMU